MIRNKCDRLDALLYSADRMRNNGRSPESTALLEEAAGAMERQQARLRIPQKDITIIRYLAANPGAVIVQERNVLGAFKWAKAAVEHEQWMDDIG